MKANVKLLTLSSLFLFSLTSPISQAARVDATLSWETAFYNDNYRTLSGGGIVNSGKARNYKGPRVDVTFRPENSQWLFRFRWNQNRSKGYINTNNGTLAGQRDYQRMDLVVIYRYRFKDGWIQPSINLRQDKNININGSNNTSDYYGVGFTYNYTISPRWIWNGSLKTEILKLEYNRDTLGTTDANQKKNRPHSRATQFSWESEQGLRYNFNSKFDITVAYNDSRNRRDDDGSWDNSTLSHTNPQLRIYTNYRTDFGLTLSPSIRKSIFGKIKIKKESNQGYEVRDLTRYAFNARYQINNNFALIAEYYREKISSSLETQQDIKQDYVRLGMNITF